MWSQIMLGRDLGRMWAAVGIAMVAALDVGGNWSASAQEFEQPADQSAEDLLSSEALAGPHYRIDDRVVSYGYLNEWRVHSDFGTFHVTGDGALRKLIREIHAISALKEISSSEAFARSIEQAAASPVQFGLKMITDPVATASSVPGGAFRIFENVGESLGSVADPTEDTTVEQAATVSTWKREYASDAGVDVYSSNLILQEELNRIGWAAAIGGLSVSAVTTPMSGGAAFAFRQTRFASQLSDAMKEEPAARLRILNGGQLRASGASPDLVDRLLDDPIYSPRHDTIIAMSLAALGGVEGLDDFLKVALSAEDEVEADFFVNQAQMLRAYVEQRGPIRELRRDGRLCLAIAEDGTKFLPVPVDRLIWTARAHQIVTALASSGGEDSGVIIWTTGIASDRVRAEVARRGITLVENVDELMDIVD